VLIDIGFLLFIAFGFWRGFTRGIIIAIFSFFAWTIGLFGALKFSSWGAFFLRDNMGIKSDYNPIISFVLIMIVISLIIYFMGKILEKMIQVVQMGWLNKTLGGLLKASIYFLMYCVIIWLFNKSGTISPEAKAQSKLFDFINPVAPAVFDWLGRNVPAMQGLLQDINRYYDQIRFPDIFR